MKNILWLVLLLAPPSLWARDAPVGEIDSYIQGLAKKGEFSGVILVSDNNQVIYQEAFGFAGPLDREPLTIRHRFNIGSVGKEFGAMAILLLHERGKLAYEQPLSDFLPELPDLSSRISIKHLLNYTSGLPDMSWHEGMTNEDVMNALKALPALDHPPGQHYRYSFYNNFLLAAVVEKVSGQAFSEYIDEHVFKPAGMRSAVVAFDMPGGTPLVARAFDKSGKPDAFPVAITGPSIYASVEDLFAWDQSLNAERLLDKCAMRIASEPFQASADGFSNSQSAFGSINFIDGQAVASLHDGSHINFKTFFYRDFARKSTIILMTNNVQTTRISDAFHRILAILKRKASDSPSIFSTCTNQATTELQE